MTVKHRTRKRPIYFYVKIRNEMNTLQSRRTRPHFSSVPRKRN